MASSPCSTRWLSLLTFLSKPVYYSCPSIHKLPDKGPEPKRYRFDSWQSKCHYHSFPLHLNQRTLLDLHSEDWWGELEVDVFPVWSESLLFELWSVDEEEEELRIGWESKCLLDWRWAFWQRICLQKVDPILPSWSREVKDGRGGGGEIRRRGRRKREGGRLVWDLRFQVWN